MSRTMANKEMLVALVNLNGCAEHESCSVLVVSSQQCQGRRDIRPWGGAKVYHRDVGVQHKCHPATGVSRSR